MKTSFVLCPIEFIFGMKLCWDELHTSLLQQLGYHCNYSDTSVTALSLGIKFIFGMRFLWEIKHQPNNLLLWFGSSSCNFSSAAKLVYFLWSY